MAGEWVEVSGSAPSDNEDEESIVFYNGDLVRVKWHRFPFGVRYLATVDGQVWHTDPVMLTAIDKATTV